MPISVRFWGTRGSIPVSGASTSSYGGNTACVEVRCGNRRLIFDAGSGIRELGDAILASREVAMLDIFFSHVHLDHLIGLPFFAPMYDPKYRVRLWAGHLLPETTLAEAVTQLMSYPLFPAGPEAFSNAEFNDFDAGESFDAGDGIVVTTVSLDHPGGATGYRIDYEGRSVTYVTDTELGTGKSKTNIVELARRTGLLIIDATYTDAELPSHRGWGHSSWQECAALADAAQVERLCLFHHDPSHDDNFMDRIARELAERRPGAMVSRDGMTIEI